MSRKKINQFHHSIFHNKNVIENKIGKQSCQERWHTPVLRRMRQENDTWCPHYVYSMVTQQIQWQFEYVGKSSLKKQTEK